MEPNRATFGKYTVLTPLEEAGTLLVQQAAEAGFARLVVIRALFETSSAPDRRTEATLADAKRAARLQHPNIRQIHEVGVVDGHGYIALEFLEGVGFDELLRARVRIPALADPRLFAALLAQTCEGLHQGHRHRAPGGPANGIIHGCLRPERLFLTSGGTIKILDFGLGRALEALSGDDLANPEHYAYMSPEQVLGRAADARSDVFSVGVLAWEALTGRRLFTRPGGRVEVLKAITQKPIPPPDSLEPSIPLPLSHVVVRALARNPEERFQTARELGIALEEGVTAIGAPLSTVAIASSVDRYFSTELEAQRSMVLRARRELEGAAADDEFEVPTTLFGGDVADLDFRQQMPTKLGRPPHVLADAKPAAVPFQPLTPPPRPEPSTSAAPRPAAPPPQPPATPPAPPPAGPSFARPPETLSDVDDPRPRANLPVRVENDERPSGGRGLLAVFLLLILAGAAGTVGYLYWLDQQQPPELSD